MLTIQPKILNNYNPAFKASKDEDYDDFSIAKMDSDKYEQMRDELREQRDEFLNLVEDEDLAIPKPINKAIKGVAIGTSALLSGMAAGWGAKKSIEGFSELGKTKVFQGLGKKLEKVKLKTAESAKSLKEKFVNSKFYKNITEKISKTYAKFGETKIGKPIVKYLDMTGNFVKKAYNKAKDGVKYVIDKIKGVKKETYTNATVNTVGVSGGVAAGVNSFREKEGMDE